MEHLKDEEVLKKDIPWDKDPKNVNYNEILFEHFLPSVEGKAKVLDKFLSLPWAAIYSTVSSDGKQEGEAEQKSKEFVD